MFIRQKRIILILLSLLFLIPAITEAITVYPNIEQCWYQGSEWGRYVRYYDYGSIIDGNPSTYKYFEDYGGGFGLPNAFFYTYLTFSTPTLVDRISVNYDYQLIRNIYNRTPLHTLEIQVWNEDTQRYEAVSNNTTFSPKRIRYIRTTHWMYVYNYVANEYTGSLLRIYDISANATSCGCSDDSCGQYPNCSNCNNSDGWYNTGGSYSCCSGSSRCTCQNQEYRDYYCSNNSCTYRVTNNRTITSNCISCGDDYCEDWGENYCKDGDVYESRTCHDRGCSGGSCYDHTSVEEQLVEQCLGDCKDGKCVNGDLDGDGDIDRDDLNILLSHKDNPASACPPCDLDGDGTITVLDGRILVNQCTCAGCICP